MCLALTGCDDVLVTTKLEPVRDDRVVGVWANGEDPSDLGVIVRSGEGYEIKPDEAGGRSTRFTLGRAGEALFAQIEERCATHVFSIPGDTRTCYQIALLEFSGNSLTFHRLDPALFETLPEVNLEYRVATSHPKSGPSVTCALIESPAVELAAFLAALPAESYTPGMRMERQEAGRILP